MSSMLSHTAARAPHRRLISACLGALALMAGLPLQACAADPAAAARIDAEIVARSQAYPALQDLTSTIGPRLTGSANGARAEAWAHQTLSGFGYEVAYQPFETVAWNRGPLALEVGGRPVASLAFGFSPVETHIDGQLVDMGNGRPEDYAAAPDKVRGKLALVYLLNLPGTPAGTPYLARNEKIALAAAHGALGVVFISYHEGNVLSTGSGAGIGETRAQLPAVLVGYEDGLALREQAAQGTVPARLNMTNTMGPATARNIVASLPGSDLAAEHIVFGAHLDSWDLATGAVDNGSGVAAVLEVARAMRASGYRPRRTIDFVLYMGEEQGMHGSRAHVAELTRKGELSSVRYMFNTDMSLDPTALNAWGFAFDETFYADLVERIRAVAPNFPGAVVQRPMPGGDSDPYQRAGIPIVYLDGVRSPEVGRCQHSNCDTIDLIDAEALARTVRISALVLEALADAGRLPSDVLTGEALDAYKTANKL